jgi:hypothetical protein
MSLEVEGILEILMLGHDGDLAAVHSNDAALQVLQLPLHHLHIVPIAELVRGLLLVTRTNINIKSLRSLFKSRKQNTLIDSGQGILSCSVSYFKNAVIKIKK